MRDNLNSAEQQMFDEMIKQWGVHVGKNRTLSKHYDGKVELDDLGISIPPAILPKVSKMGLMWSKQAVNRVADCSVIEGFNFNGSAPEGFLDVMERNQFYAQYDESLPSELTHGLVFYTVTAGDIGEPPAIISTYDAEHATALYDYRHKTTLCGLSIVDVDIQDQNRPTAVNFYAPDGTIVEMELSSDGRWLSRRLNYGTGRCMMEVMRNDPDLRKPYGRSVLTSAILQHELEANRQFVRGILTGELGAMPQKWVMGADDDLFEGDRWEAYLGSIFALGTGADPDQLPVTGQYPQIDMTQGVAYIRNLANQFAAEASIPIHSLLYTEANPASAEAIEASRHDLVEKVEKLNRVNGHALKNVGLMALSLIQEKPIDQLGENERSLAVKWKNPLHPSLAASADAAQKISAQVQGFAGTPTYWRMLGYTDSEIEGIMAEVEANKPAPQPAPQPVAAPEPQPEPEPADDGEPL